MPGEVSEVSEVEDGGVVRGVLWTEAWSTDEEVDEMMSSEARMAVGSKSAEASAGAEDEWRRTEGVWSGKAGARNGDGFDDGGERWVGEDEVEGDGCADEGGTCCP